jgi:hypothetical protein
MSLEAQLLPMVAVSPQRAFARPPRALDREGKLLAHGPYVACVASAEAAAKFPPRWASAVLQHATDSNQMLAVVVYKMGGDPESRIRQYEIERPQILARLAESFEPVALIQYEAVELRKIAAERNVVVSDVWISKAEELLNPDVPLMWIPFLACVRAQVAEANLLAENGKHTWTATRTVYMDGVSDRLAEYQGFKPINEVQTPFGIGSVVQGQLSRFVDMAHINALEERGRPPSTFTEEERQRKEDFRYPPEAERYAGMTLEFLTEAKLQEAMERPWAARNATAVRLGMQRNVQMAHYPDFRHASLLFRDEGKIVAYADLWLTLDSVYTLYSFVATEDVNNGSEELQLLINFLRYLTAHGKSLWSDYLRPGADDRDADQYYSDPPKFLQALVSGEDEDEVKLLRQLGFINASRQPDIALRSGLVTSVSNVIGEVATQNRGGLELYFIELNPVELTDEDDDREAAIADRRAAASGRTDRGSYREDLLRLKGTRSSMSDEQRAELAALVASRWPGIELKA